MVVSSPYPQLFGSIHYNLSLYTEKKVLNIIKKGKEKE